MVLQGDGKSNFVKRRGQEPTLFYDFGTIHVDKFICLATSQTLLPPMESPETSLN